METNSPQLPTPTPISPGVTSLITAVVSFVIILGLSLVVQFGLNLFLRDVTFNRVHLSYGGAVGLLTSLYIVGRMFAATFVGEAVSRVAEILKMGVTVTPGNDRIPDEKESP
jgi:hypothetical protein